MTNKLKITSLRLNTADGRDIVLTIEEAMELYKQLDSMFGSRTNISPICPITIIKDRWTPPYQPVWYGDTVITTSGNTLQQNEGLQRSVSGNTDLVVDYFGIE